MTSFKQLQEHHKNIKDLKSNIDILEMVNRDYISEQTDTNISTIAMMIEDFSFFSDADTIMESISESELEEPEEKSKNVNIKKLRDSIGQHAKDFLESSPEEQKKSLADAKEHFAKTDLRTEQQKKDGPQSQKNRDEWAKKYLAENPKPAGKTEAEHASHIRTQLDKAALSDHSLKIRNGRKPIHYKGGFTESSKMTSQNKGRTEEYVSKRDGKEKTVLASSLTPGVAHLPSGEKLTTCPYATKACGGHSEVNKDTGLGQEAGCLHNHGQSSMIGSKEARHAETVAATQHSKQYAIIKADAYMKSAKKQGNHESVVVRDDNASDLKLHQQLLKHVNDHLPADKQIDNYGYTKAPMGDHKNTRKDYRVKSDPGQPIDRQTESQQKDLVNNLNNNGEHAAAYSVLGIRRGGHNMDVLDKVKKMSYHVEGKKHTFAAHANLKDTEYGQNTGDLRLDDRTASEIAKEQHLSPEDTKKVVYNDEGKPKGRVTITSVSKMSGEDIKKSPFFHKVNKKTLDDTNGELHVSSSPEHQEHILYKNIKHHLSKGHEGHIELAKHYNDFLEDHDYDAAKKIKDGLDIHSVSHDTDKNGNIKTVNNVDIKDKPESKTSPVNFVKTPKTLKDIKESMM